MAAPSAAADGSGCGASPNQGDASAGSPRAKQPRLAAAASALDEEFMRAAIAEGTRGRVTAPPNPWVGCVLARGDRIVARGYHVRAGEAHAEVAALRNLPDGEPGEGLTCYVTLEPCSHVGRTGACCEALRAAGIPRVVIACGDPDPRVSGRGAQFLKSHGIAVTTGVCEDEAEESLLPYLHQRRTGRPYVVLKTALTVDGCIACADGTSQWITGPAARQRAHRVRAESQAIIVGSGTALADDPRLTVRGQEPMPAAQPLRVLLDRRGRVHRGNLLNCGQAPTLVATAEGADAAAQAAWRAAGVEVDATAGNDPAVLLGRLAGRGILQVMVEGGGEVHSDFLKRELCDRLVVFVGATVFGSGRRWLRQELCPTIADAKFLRLRHVAQLGDDICLEYVRR